MCVLRAYGKNFDVDRFLKKCPWKVSVTYRGDVYHQRKAAKSGFNALVSNDASMELAPQLRDAVKFIKKNRNLLIRLRKCPGLEGMELDFLLAGRLRPKKIAVYEERLPAEFIQLAGATGLSVALTICDVYADFLRPKKASKRQKH